MADQNRRDLIIALTAALVVAAVVWFVFLPALSNGFVDWDDQAGIVENERIRTLDGESILWMFSTFQDGNWIPLNWLSHAVVYSIAGLDPAAHHIANILLHCLNGVLFFSLCIALLRRTGGGRTRSTLFFAAFAALFWAIHPLRVESVVWITERKDLGNALFFFLALITYLRYCDSGRRGALWYCSSLLFFVLSLLFKSMTVTLPLVLLLLDWCPLGRLGRRPGRVLAEKIPFLALSLLFGILAITAQSSISGVVASVDALPVDFRVMNALRSIVFYLQKTVLPVELAPLYPMTDPATTTYTAITLGSALFIAAVSAALIFLAKRGRPIPLAAWLFFLVTLAPVLGLLQVGRQAAADRYTYIPALCLGLLVAGALRALCSRAAGDGNTKRTIPGRRVLLLSPFLLAPLLLVWLTVLGTTCAGQIKVWENAATLWEHQTRLYPGRSNTAYCNLAVASMAAGRVDDCIRAYQTAMALGENYPASHYNLACALLERGRFDKAIRSFEKAIAGDSGYAAAYRGLWQAYTRMGNDDDALNAIERAILLDPETAAYKRNLGLTMLRRDQFDSADKAFEDAAATSPDDAALLAGIASAQMNHGRLDAARFYAEKALTVSPRSAEIRLTMGLICIKSGLFSAAVDHLREASALTPEDPTVSLLLGEAYEKSGMSDEALRACRRAVELDPAFAPAHNALARIYRRAGRLELARTHMQKAAALDGRVNR
jgi:protein O-mannosyl-transferase